ncbi:MAG: HAD-IIA family hydrolase [Lentisphaerae bacterium]|nr:HAD-IIA family hydrolase [Lentisphaerota bacterium]
MNISGKLSAVKAVFLDMDGTIYHGSKLFPTTIPFLNFLKEHNIKYLFCTNNSSRSKADYVKHLAGFGLASSTGEFYTSVDFLIDTLREAHPHAKRLFVLGVDSMLQELTENGFEIVDDNPDVNVVSFDKTLTYERLCKAAYFLQSGVPSYSTHPDLFCPTDQATVLVDCGAISRCVELAAGKKLVQLGKPHGGFLQHAAARLGLPPQATIMCGDRMATDIASGVNAGTLTCRITGEGADLTSQADVTPDFCCEDLGELQQLWQAIF